MAKKGNLSIPWPFEGMNIRLNTDTGFLKLIAIVTMLIDHMGAIFFPQYRVMRIIGRIAFPIYAYCLTVGCVYTHDMLRYVQRVVLLALIAQPIYVVAMHHTNAAMYAVSFAEQPVRAALNFYIASWNDPSILLSLALGLILLWSIRDRHLVVTAAALLFCWIIRGRLDYGFNGILLMLLFFLFSFVHVRFPAKKMILNIREMTRAIGDLLQCLRDKRPPSDPVAAVHGLKENCEMLVGVGLGELQDSEVVSFDQVKQLMVWEQLYDRIEQTVLLFSELTDTLEQAVLKYA